MNYNEDGNVLGRLGAVALLALAAFGVHRLNCAESKMCPLMQTSSCCAGAAVTASAKPAAK